MFTFEPVPPHSAFVGAAQTTVEIAIGVDVPTTLELLDNEDGAYSFAGSPTVEPGDTSVSLQFQPTEVGESGAKLRAGAAPSAPTAALRGEGRFPIVFSKQSLEFGPVVVGERVVLYVDALNNSGEVVTLELEATAAGGEGDKDRFEVLTTVLAPTGGAIPILVGFKPDAQRDFQAQIAARINGLEKVLEISGRGVLTPEKEDGFIDQALPPSNPPPGAPVQTRFSVFVPEHASHFNMGAPSPDDAGANRVKIAGIGLTTRERILLSATGPADVSKAAVMAQGDVIVQSNERDVLTLSKEDNILAAGRNAYVVGDNGVFIASVAEDATDVGPDGFPLPRVRTDGSPSTIKSAQNAAIVFGSLDAFVATLGAGRALTHAFSKRWTSSMFPPSIAAIGGVAAAVCSGCSAGGVLPTTTIYGHAGVLMGTPGFGSFYALAGLVLASSFPVIMGFDTEIVGLHSVGMVGARVGVSSTSETTLHSHAKVSIKADGESTLGLGGPGEVEVEAATQIIAQVTNGYSLSMEAGTVRLVSVPAPAAPPVHGIPVAPPTPSGDLELGNRLVRFTVANVQVELTDTTLTLTDGANGRVTLTSGQITMAGANGETATLGGGNIAFNAPNAGANISLDAAHIALRTPGEAMFTLGQMGMAGNVQLQGSRILLG